MRYITFVTIFLIFLSAFIVTINPKFPQKVQIQSADVIPIFHNNKAAEKDFIVDNNDSIKNTNNINTKKANTIQLVDNVNTKDIELEGKWRQLLAIAEQEQKQEQKPNYSQRPSRIQTIDNKTKYTNLAKNHENSNFQMITLEENIAWNKWRANLANHIVMSLEAKGVTNLIPVGTQYIYTFCVSSQGKITNINVGIIIGEDNSTTRYGATIIKDTIESLNHSQILKFPRGSQRTAVNVLSGFKLTYGPTRYINEDAFNDIEKVKNYYYE